MKFGHIVTATLISLNLISSAYSSTISLFDSNGQPHGEISKKTIHRGDILSFSDGHQYEVVSYLGQGNVNVLFKVRMLNAPEGVPDLLALRLPMIIQGQKYKRPPQVYIDSYIDGYAALANQVLSIPKLIRSSKSQYVASEFVENDFNGHDFFTDPDRLARKYSAKVLQEAEEALVEFARMTVRVKNIGDFGPGQMVYNIKTKSWTLLDWFNAHDFVTHNFNKSKAHAFKEGFEADLTLTTDEKGIPVGQRLLSARERRIIDRLGLTVIAERRNFCFFRRLINSYAPVFKSR